MHLTSLIGQWPLVALTFAAVDTALGADTAIPLVGLAGTGALPAMPCAGFVVGMAVGCEAGANFTLEVTIDGVQDADSEVAVAAAAVYKLYRDGKGPSFVAGQTVGVNVDALTTEKDVTVVLLLALDMNS